MQITDFFDFMKQAGAVALECQNGIKPSDVYYKDNLSTGIVTRADTEISRLFAEFIKSYGARMSYAVIDEEVAMQSGNDAFAVFETSDYQFVLDPIDGTLTYSYQTPLYAVSLGILKRGRPYMGIVYAPALQEAVYCDGKTVHWLKKPFSAEEEDMVLQPGGRPSQLIFKNAHTFDLRQEYGVNGNLAVNFWSCVVHNLYVLTGRGKAAFVSAKLWDLAGAWAAFDLLGYKIYNIANGSELTSVCPSHFDPNLQLTYPHVICRQEDYSAITALIKSREDAAG